LRGADAAVALHALRGDFGACERDVLLRGAGLRILCLQRRLRLEHRVVLVGVVEPDQDLTAMDRLVRIDQDLVDALLDLARHGHRVGVDPGVVGRLVRERVGEEARAPDQDRDHDDRAEHQNPERRTSPLGAWRLVGPVRRGYSAAFSGRHAPSRRFGTRFHC